MVSMSLDVPRGVRETVAIVRHPVEVLIGVDVVVVGWTGHDHLLLLLVDVPVLRAASPPS